MHFKQYRNYIFPTKTTDRLTPTYKENQTTCYVLISIYAFKFFKSVHHHTIQINQPTRCNSFSSLLLDVYAQLNMFRAS